MKETKKTIERLQEDNMKTVLQEGCHACVWTTDDGRRNVKIELEFCSQNSQKDHRRTEVYRKRKGRP